MINLIDELNKSNLTDKEIVIDLIKRREHCQECTYEIKDFSGGIKGLAMDTIIHNSRSNLKIEFEVGNLGDVVSGMLKSKIKNRTLRKKFDKDYSYNDAKVARREISKIKNIIRELNKAKACS